MARSLDQMLEDGERVIYRAPVTGAPKRAQTMVLIAASWAPALASSCCCSAPTAS